MIKAIAILAFAGVASAGVLAPQLAYAQTYAQPQFLQKTIAQPLAYAAQPILKAAPVAYAQPILKAAPVAYAQPIVQKTLVASPEPYDPNPQYNYGYSVSDALTGDSKTAHESRNGDVVQGQYSLVEPDGSIRTVTYTADPINGFNAVVDRQAPGVVKAVAPVVKTIAPVAYAQPQFLQKTIAQPLAYAAQPALLKAPVGVAYGQPLVQKTIYG